MYHRGDIPASGGGLFHSETGPALGIAGTCGEIQNRRPAADIVIGRNFSRSASDNIGHDLLDVRRLYGRCRQFHRADVFLRCGPRDADHIFRQEVSLPAGRPAGVQIPGMCTGRGRSRKGSTRKSIDSNLRSDDSHGIGDLRIDKHHSARAGRRHPHRMRHLRSSDQFNAGHVGTAAAMDVRGRCGSVPALGYDSVMEQVRLASVIQQHPDNDHLLLRTATDLAHRRRGLQGKTLTRIVRTLPCALLPGQGQTLDEVGFV